VGGGGSLPNALDRNTQSVKFGHAVVALDEQHYKNDVCVLRVYGSTFGASDVCAGGRAYEDGAPCVLPQHLAALPIVAL
tara:strand:+ start:145 stop:381 length:237 start_codon:yes stop_codon:yes gene_type:complete